MTITTARNTLKELRRRVVAKFAPPQKISVAAWAEKYRYLSAETSAMPGRYSLAITPYLRGILDCINDRAVRKLVCCKSAQVGWTDGVINNYLGYSIHIDPAPIGIMFPRDQTAKDYNVEKLLPMVEATPVLGELVNVKTRTLDNTQNRKRFPGGFLKLFGSNSTGGVKSTPLKRVIVEEPDDCNLNIKGQGDSIKLAEERVKTFHDSKILAGGTPTIKGVSSIAAEMEISDKRQFEVPCHDCEEAHALSFDNVKWQERADGLVHTVYGKGLPETARYVCPHCGSLWNDTQKNRNVRRAEAAGFGWRATAEFRGVVGFYLNEMYSPFKESSMERLVEKYLVAVHELEVLGDPGAMITFTNSSRGEPYEYKSDAPELDDLKVRAKEYAENTVPAGGLVLTIGVDVQHDRLALIIRAWGRGEESWLLYWGEIMGSTLVANAGAWIDLDKIIFDTAYRHESGADLRIMAGSIDSSDGAATEAVYSYVRSRRGRACRLMAIKGHSETTDEKREIFTTPKVVDLGKKNKASKFGLQLFKVGTIRAKDTLLDNRLKLTGDGPGRMHWYAGVRADYWEQLVSEVKAPHRTVKGKKVWQKKAGVRNEALDSEVYALHAARALKTHLMKDAHWTAIEARLRQRTLLAPADDESNEHSPGEPATTERDEAPASQVAADKPGAAAPETATAVHTSTPKKPNPRRGPPRRGGFVSNW
jgi:phage terminase large subunit GpA-like protein